MVCQCPAVKQSELSGAIIICLVCDIHFTETKSSELSVRCMFFQYVITIYVNRYWKECMVGSNQESFEEEIRYSMITLNTTYVPDKIKSVYCIHRTRLKTVTAEIGYRD